MKPTEWKEFALTFSQCWRYIRHANANTHKFIVFIGDKGYEIIVNQWEIHITVVFLLFFGQRLIVVEWLISLVNDIEIFVIWKPFYEFFLRFKLHNIKLVAI